MKYNVLSQISHQSEAMDLFGSNDSCQGLIWHNHPSVERVLEVVVPDVVPGQPHNLSHGGSLHTDDCHQVLVNLQLSSQVPVASVASPVEPLSPDPVSSWVDSIPAFDQMIRLLCILYFFETEISEHLLSCLEQRKQCLSTALSQI